MDNTPPFNLWFYMAISTYNLFSCLLVFHHPTVPLTWPQVLSRSFSSTTARYTHFGSSENTPNLIGRSRAQVLLKCSYYPSLHCQTGSYSHTLTFRAPGHRSSTRLCILTDHRDTGSILVEYFFLLPRICFLKVIQKVTAITYLSCFAKVFCCNNMDNMGHFHSSKRCFFVPLFSFDLPN